MKKTREIITNGMARRADLEGKYIFWDIDGTLAPFRFDGLINLHPEVPEELIDSGVFLQREPSRMMQEVTRTCRAEKQVTISHVHSEREIADKREWIERYFPDIAEAFLVPFQIPKVEALKAYCSANDIPLDKVVFVDDTIEFCDAMEKEGIKSFHISSFLDWNYELTA